MKTGNNDATAPGADMFDSMQQAIQTWMKLWDPSSWATTGDSGTGGQEAATAAFETMQQAARSFSKLWDPAGWWGLGMPSLAGSNPSALADLQQAFGSFMKLWDPTPWLGTPPRGTTGAGAEAFEAMQQAFGSFTKLWDPAGWTARDFRDATMGPPGGWLAETAPLTDWVSLGQRLQASGAIKAWQDWWDYWVDWMQRWVLYFDVLRQRGNNMLEHWDAGMPPLLDYAYEVILDARTFARPANYQLLHILPPDGRKPAPGRRPLVIIDPRAGHGPGIGGFKQDSEVGMGLTEGHPVYFVVFTPTPCPGQTLEDVEQAEVRFIEEVHRRHPDRDVPMVYGNCQAGWAVAMLGADRPDVTGPIVINGAPLSYWSGAPGVNPMRLTGGLTGGAWATRLLCDLGGGIFDGAWLVQNFENLNPANTLWQKEYSLWARIDTEPERYLEFERWWTGFFLLTEDEILWIVNNLFIGDKLEHGQLILSPNHRINLRDLADPLVVFASSGDNITPPHQALHWISELYETTDALKKADQRIVYLINPHIGHLGIFVSAKVARREHRAIIEHIERIRQLPPGLYQMIIEGETGETDPLKDQFVVRFEERRIRDVRFSGEREAFARMAEVSRANEALYLAFGRPLVQQLTTGWNFAALRWLHPARLNRVIFSDRVTPAMNAFAAWAPLVRENRQAVDEKNVFKALERRLSDALVASLNAFRDERDNAFEWLFTALYGV